MPNFSIAVLNPKGRDPEQYFNYYAGTPDVEQHAPVNYHAYAACVGGSFQVSVEKAILLGHPILLLIRSDLKRSLQALNQLKNAGITVAVTLKETGFHQFAELARKPSRLALFKKIVTEADGAISPTEAMLPIFREMNPDKPERAKFIPTPYPVLEDAWNFSIPIPERKGIFVGTRELDTISRNHLQAVICMAGLMRQTGERATLISKDPRKIREYFAAIGISSDQVDILNPMSYSTYLTTMARHRIVFQLDQSQVPGQVAGDACLCRTICVGGNGTIESIVFPKYASGLQERSAILSRARELLTDDDVYEKALSSAEKRAQEWLSFPHAAKLLESFYNSLSK